MVSAFMNLPVTVNPDGLLLAEEQMVVYCSLETTLSPRDVDT